MKLLKANLKQNHEVQSIYFSAWEDDFSKEPLISILGELNKFIEEKYKTPNEITTEITTKFNKTKEFAIKVLKRGLPALIKGTTSGILDIDKAYESAISAMSEQVTSELIDNYSQDKLITKKFKESMKELLKEINSKKPFVFFIDELDRCRPLYAIELLERIKHIFGIDNLIFILSIDKVQLSESIKSQYGNIDTNNYLRRFIDLEYTLQNPSTNKFCEKLVKQFKLNETLKKKNIEVNYNHNYYYVSFLKFLVKTLKLSLRQIEQVFIHIDIIYKTIQKEFKENNLKIIVFFVILKSYDSIFYEKVINKSKNIFDIHELNFNSLSELQDNDENKTFKILIKAINLVVSKNDTEYDDIIAKEEKSLKELNNSNHNKSTCQSILVRTLKYSVDYGDNRLNQRINTVIKQIEFTKQFELTI